jgi:NAD(P)-dependent dehydrogenase (short-subunit alcohol dehydrogenase family)
VLVNNAGIAWTGQALDMLQTMLRVNVEGVFIVSRAILPHMITQRLGSVVNLAWSRRRRFPAPLKGAGWGGGDAAGSERVVPGRRWPVSSLALLATSASVLTPSQTLPLQGPFKGEGLTDRR